MIDRRRILTKIVQSFSVVGIFFAGYPFIKYLRHALGIKLVEECSLDYLAKSTREHYKFIF